MFKKNIGHVKLFLSIHLYGVWYGMVWYGMVWYGMVWYGMVWYGMVWYGMVWYGMVWYGMVWYGNHQCNVPRTLANILRHSLDHTIQLHINCVHQILKCFTLPFIIPRTALLSFIQSKAETFNFSTHALPRNL